MSKRTHPQCSERFVVFRRSYANVVKKVLKVMRRA